MFFLLIIFVLMLIGGYILFITLKGSDETGETKLLSTTEDWRALPEPDESTRRMDFDRLHDESGKTPVERLLEDEEESNEHKL